MQLTPAIAARLMALTLAQDTVDAAGWWTLLTCARAWPALPEAEAVRDRAMGRFGVDEAMAGGWAWQLTLHAEMRRHRQSWAGALDAQARAAVRAAHLWVRNAAYPVRAGNAANSGFAMIHGHAWATRHDPELALALTALARRWFGRDRAAQVWEPDADAQLSPILSEAHAMLRLLPRGEFEPWLAALLPGLDDALPPVLFEPARGLPALNLGRAWSWRAIGERLPLSHVVHAAADRHLAAALPGLAAEPWAACFALLALLPDSPDTSA